MTKAASNSHGIKCARVDARENSNVNGTVTVGFLNVFLERSARLEFLFALWASNCALVR